MEAVRTWLLSVTGASMLIAAADALCPDGVVKRMVRLIGGLALLMVMFSPSVSWKGEYELQGLDDYKAIAQETVDRAAEEQEDQVVGIIETKTAAYIVDKAAGLGAGCTAQVTCETKDEGITIPTRAVIYGTLDEEQRKALAEIIANDLGIPRDRQYYEGE